MKTTAAAASVDSRGWYGTATTLLYVQMSTASQSANCSRVDVRITAHQPTCHDYSASNNDIVTTYLFPPRNYLSRLVYLSRLGLFGESLSLEYRIIACKS